MAGESGYNIDLMKYAWLKNQFIARELTTQEREKNELSYPSDWCRRLAFECFTSKNPRLVAEFHRTVISIIKHWFLEVGLPWVGIDTDMEVTVIRSHDGNREGCVTLLFKEDVIIVHIEHLRFIEMGGDDGGGWENEGEEWKK